MKILCPSLNFASRWYAKPITCPHCSSRFILEEDDMHHYDKRYDEPGHRFQLSEQGIGGMCPSCNAPVYVEKPT